MKKILSLALTVIIMFSIIIKVNAAEVINSINITLRENKIPTGEGEHDIFRKYANGSLNAYCIDGFDEPIMEMTCTKAGLSVEFGAIIKAATNGHTGSNVIDSEYLLAQAALAIHHKNNTAYMPESLIAEANSKISAAAADISKQKSQIKLTKTTDFELKNDNYVATFTASGGDSIKSVAGCSVTVETPVEGQTNARTNVSGATASINGEVVTVTVPKNKLNAGTTNVNLNCTNIIKYYYASQYYTCEGDYQDITLAREKWEETGSAGATGNIVIEKEEEPKDNKGSIKISKRGQNSKGTKKFLEGVKFQIKNSKGNTINASGKEEKNYVFTTDVTGIVKVTGIEISDKAAENIYTITEIETLAGYVLQSTPIEANLNKLKDDDYNFVYNMTNETTKVTISKTDATGKKELKGAKLSILDKDGKVLKKCVFDDENNLITYSDGSDAKDCTWVSTEKEKTLEGLPIGKYYLVEDLAPNGYTKSSEKIEIEITKDGAVKDKIAMKNALEVKVPDTLSGKSTLLLAVAMFDIALGIGILLYVRKNKIEE